jgi:hypothetical protein
MSFSDLASIGSFVSASAVLVSLIYLAIQVRQAEKNQRAVLNQGYITRVTDYLRWYAESPINELRARVMAGDISFTAEELLRLQLALRVTLLSAQDAYLQHKAGLVDAMTLDNSMRSIRITWLNFPVYRALWQQQAPTIAPEFAAVIETMLRETPVTKPSDMVSLFRADLAKIA